MRREAYPEGLEWDGPVQEIQTHLSSVFLTAFRVVKLRKSVDLGFVDFSSRAKRNADCLAEVALNRRLAQDVYLGVAPLLRTPPGYRLGPVGEALATVDGQVPEHAVVMRRLPEGADALSRLERGALGEPELDGVAQRLADFHAEVGMGKPAPFDTEMWRRRIWEPLEACLDSLTRGESVAPEQMATLAERARTRFAALREDFEQRRSEGRAVEGHGDVHLQHVWFEAGAREPLLVDCVEFDQALRQIDVASEVAFLAMDLAYRGRPELAEYFLWRYADVTDDWGLYAVVDFHMAYRALVRAKVADLAARDGELAPKQREAAARSATHHVSLAEAALAEPVPGRIVVLCGHVGSGKSSVARALASELRGVVLATDRVRRHQGVEAEAGALPRTLDAGRYRPEARAAAYAGLLARSVAPARSGRTVLLDATYERQDLRAEARAFAREQGFEAWLVHVRCDPQLARKRLQRRQAEGGDPSEAGPELLAPSLTRFEPPDEWPADRRAVVDTGRADWRGQLHASSLLRGHPGSSLSRDRSA